MKGAVAEVGSETAQRKGNPSKPPGFQVKTSFL